MNDSELGYQVTTPASATSIKLLGLGAYCGGLGLSVDEMSTLAKLYGYNLSEPNALLKVGAIRNLLRHAQKDGLRMIAVFARHLEQNQDPVKELVCLMNDGGWDVSNHIEWACEEDE